MNRPTLLQAVDRALTVPIYPWALIRPFELADGAALLLRPIRPDDEPRLVELFHRLSPRTVYQRFFRAYDQLPEGWYQRFANVDYRTRLALVAEEQEAGGPVLRAVARYEPGDTPGTTEIAIVVEDAWQGRGVGGCCSTPCSPPPRPVASAGSRPTSWPTTGRCSASCPASPTFGAASWTTVSSRSSSSGGPWPAQHRGDRRRAALPRGAAPASAQLALIVPMRLTSFASVPLLDQPPQF